MKSEWIPIETRKPTGEERLKIERIYDEFAADETDMFSCPMPEHGQEILISTRYGVSIDTCSIDTDEGLNIYELEARGDWEGVDAWMPLPEPYKR